MEWKLERQDGREEGDFYINTEKRGAEAPKICRQFRGVYGGQKRSEEGGIYNAADAAAISRRGFVRLRGNVATPLEGAADSGALFSMKTRVARTPAAASERDGGGESERENRQIGGMAMAGTSGHNKGFVAVRQAVGLSVKMVEDIDHIKYLVHLN